MLRTYTQTGREDLPRILAALLLVCCFASPLGAAGLDPGSAWPMFHRNLGHSARSTDLVPVSGAVAWMAALSDSVEYSSPVVGADGTIYIGDQGKELWAFWPWGWPKWNYHTGGNLRYSTPAVSADSTIYIGSADGKLYAIRHDGTLKWASPTGGPVKTSPAIAEDGTVYVGSDDGKLWAFWPDGSVRWTFVAGDTIRSSPTVASDGTIYFGSYNGNVYAVHPDGSPYWTGATGGPIKASPAIGQGNHIVVGSGDGFLYYITSDGQISWAVFTNQNLRSSPAIGVTGKIYLGLDTKIAAYHDSGDPAWDYDTGGRVYSSPCVYTAIDSSEVVYCGSDSGQLYAVRYGALLWSSLIGSAVRSSPCITSDIHILVASMRGGLYSIGYPYVTSVGGGPGGRKAVQLRIVPNPVAAGRNLSIELAGAESIRPGRLMVFDPSGRLVLKKTLAPGASARWEGTDSFGRPLPSGVYLIRWSDGRSDLESHVVRIR